MQTEQNSQVVAARAFILEHRIALSASVVAALSISAIIFGGNPVSLALLLGPIVLGAIVVIAGNESFNDWVDARRKSFEGLRVWGAARQTKPRRYAATPAAKGSMWLWRQTETISDPSVRSGVRIGAALYFWAGLLALVIAAVYIIVAVLMLIAIIWVASSIFGSSSGESNSGSPDRIRSSNVSHSRSGNERRINPETGVEEEQTWLGWSSVKNADGNEERINPETGVREEMAWLGWSAKQNGDGNEVRTNSETGVQEEHTWTGWSSKSNTSGRDERINPETGVVEEQSFLGWVSKRNDQDREERVNPETGVTEESTLFGWSPKK